MDSQTPAADGRLLSCLALMVREGASDLFLLAGAPPTLKRQGAFLPITKGSVTAEDVRTMVYSIMRKAQIDEFEARRNAIFRSSRRICRATVSMCTCSAAMWGWSSAMSRPRFLALTNWACRRCSNSSPS